MIVGSFGERKIGDAAAKVAASRGLPPVEVAFKKRSEKVFHLKAYDLDVRYWGSKQIHKQKDGSIIIQDTDIGIYRTLDQAELAMLHYVDYDSEHGVRLGFEITERVVGKLFDLDRGPNDEVSCRIYGSGGDFMCSREFGSDSSKSFFGREPKDVPLKKGAYGYMLFRGRAVPICVISPPPTKKEWAKMNKGEKPGEVYGGDFSDDCYLAYSIWGHHHAGVTGVFPVVGTISKKIKDQIAAAMKVDESEENYRRWCRRHAKELNQRRSLMEW